MLAPAATGSSETDARGLATHPLASGIEKGNAVRNS